MTVVEKMEKGAIWIVKALFSPLYVARGLYRKSMNFSERTLLGEKEQGYVAICGNCAKWHPKSNECFQGKRDKGDPPVGDCFEVSPAYIQKMKVKQQLRWLTIVVGLGVFIIIGLSFIFFTVVPMIALFVVTVVMVLYTISIAFGARVWYIGKFGFAKTMMGLDWGKDRVWDVTKWFVKWWAIQPTNDYRYGRRKRKDLELSKTYAE